MHRRELQHWAREKEVGSFRSKLCFSNPLQALPPFLCVRKGTVTLGSDHQNPSFLSLAHSRGSPLLCVLCFLPFKKIPLVCFLTGKLGKAMFLKSRKAFLAFTNIVFISCLLAAAQKGSFLYVDLGMVGHGEGQGLPNVVR